MAMSLSIKTDTFSPAENQTWLASAEGTQNCDSVTLDGALFLAADFPNGIVPSGTPLGKVTATGLYGASKAAATDGSQVVVGHLFTTQDLTAGGKQAATSRVPAPLFWGPGEVILAKLPAVAGGVDLSVAGNQPKLIKYI